MDLLRLSSILDRYATGFRPSTAEPVSGSGLSGAEVYRIVAPAGTFSLRCWPAEHPSDDQLRGIHRLLEAAFRRGCSFIPVPIVALAGESFVEVAGRRWQLEPWMPGQADLSPRPRLERLAAAMTALAQFHQATAEDGSSFLVQRAHSPGIAERLRILKGCLSGDVQKVRDALGSAVRPEWQTRAERYFTLFAAAVGAVYDRLKLVAANEYRLQPVIRDVHREHLLFDGDRVTGIVDFGAMSVDHPAVDLARLFGSFEIDDVPTRSELVQVYDPRFTREELELIDAFDRSGALLSPFRWLWWLFVERRTFRDERAVAHRFDVLLQRLTRLSAESTGARVGDSLF
ncbi:MAG: phosphotransferase [Planctomycetia bacterium]|nr:phosphotransferase [Planctomycetia bacterium]